jgi:hypothetical protein
MSDNSTTLPSEIEESTGNEATGAGTSDTNTTSSESEQEQELSLDALSPSQTPSKPKVDYAEMQVDKWLKKVTEDDTGESWETLAANPSLNWVAKRVKSKLNIDEPQSNVASEIKAYEASKQFETNKKLVESLPVKLRNKLIKNAKSMIDELGVDNVKALNYAVEKSMSEINEQKGTLENRKAGQGIPKGKPQATAGTYTMEQLSQMDNTEYKRVRDLADKGEITIIN